MFSCEFCEIFKSTFLTEHNQTTASVGMYLGVQTNPDNELFKIHP